MRCQDVEDQALNNTFPTSKWHDASAPPDGFGPTEDEAQGSQTRNGGADNSSEWHQPGKDQLGRMQCEAMKVILLALLDRIDALESEVHEDQVDTLDLRAEVNQFESSLIRAALTSTKGRQRRAARLLGMKVSTLNAKLRRHGVIQAAYAFTEATRDYSGTGADG